FAFPTREAERGYLRMFDYSEHSWPTSPPARDVHQFNSQWGKILEGGRALRDAEQLSGTSMQALAGQIPTGADRELVVFNPLARARSDLVATAEEIPGLIDPATGAPIPVQQLADGQTVFVATDVPAFGYKCYRLAAGPPPTASSAPAL